MKRMRTSAVLAAGVVASAVLVGAPVAAQDAGEAPTLAITPSSGPGGTNIGVSGTNCFGTTEFGFGLADSEDALDYDTAVADDAGTWSGQLDTPVDADPNAAYVVAAWCIYGEGEDDYELIDVLDFDITESTTPPTTTPPTVPPTVSPTTPPTTAPVTPPTTVKPSAKPTTTVPAPTPATPIVKAPETLG